MIPFAVDTAVSVVALIGLAVGLVVLFVVIWLLNDVLAPLRRTSNDIQDALTAPMLERGVPGTEQLGATRRLADSVPDLALAYLQTLSLSPRPAEAVVSNGAPAASAPEPAPSRPDPGPPAQEDEAGLPAWKRYRG